MNEYETGAVRDTGGKGRMDLLPMCALLRISRHMEDALTHYPERNWEKGLPIHSMIDSAFRHLVKYMDGQTDEDHLCAAATNLLMAMWTEEKMPQMQDVPARQSIPQTEEVETEPSTPEPDQKEFPQICQCYDADEHRCNGTRERDYCSCHGDRTVCDFYSSIRKLGRRLHEQQRQETGV